jgi:hypothetical protein
MHASGFLLLLCLTAQPGTSSAQSNGTLPPPPARQVRGLSNEEAKDLLARLEKAQRRLRSGETQSFALLAGSMASHPMANVSPRDAFLSIPFRKVWNIERLPSDNRLWQPYRLSYAPNGLGQLFWEIEIALGFNGDLERVLMNYKPPAPF